MKVSEEVPGLFVAPTEPRQLKRLGKVSSLPERFGCDFLWPVKGGFGGVQRKEFKDLLASIADGRLTKEVSQMARVKRPVLVVEAAGNASWTLDGELVDRWSRMTRGQLRALLWSVREKGVWVEASDSITDTGDVVRGLVGWTRKERHQSLVARPKPKGAWGRVDDRGWALHLLTSFEGIGPGTAEAMLKHFGGVPMRWEVGVDELSEVVGIGRVRAERLVRALGNGERA